MKKTITVSFTFDSDAEYRAWEDGYITDPIDGDGEKPNQDSYEWFYNHILKHGYPTSFLRDRYSGKQFVPAIWEVIDLSEFVISTNNKDEFILWVPDHDNKNEIGGTLLRHPNVADRIFLREGNTFASFMAANPAGEGTDGYPTLAIVGDDKYPWYFIHRKACRLKMSP